MTAAEFKTKWARYRGKETSTYHLAHKRLDAAAAAAHGWPADLSDDQILERLLALNLERAAEEAQAQQSPKPKPAQRHKVEQEMI